MNNIKKNGKWIYVVAFIVPWLVVIMHSLVRDSWLTGNGSMIAGDMSMQILPFFYELWNRVHLGDFSDFTWNIAGGVDFNTVLGYMMSPFTLLILVLPKTWIVDGIQVVMVLKWALMAVSMVFFFEHTRFNTLKEHRRLVSLFLGLVFVLSNGMINFILYIQFMDVMICFPILLLLVEKMVDEGRWKLYYIILLFCMYSNSYIAYEVCLFLVLWFFMQYTRNSKNKLKSFFKFAGSSVLAAMTCFSTLLGGVILSQSRLETENTTQTLKYVSSILVSVTDYIKQFFVLTYLSETSSKIPNVYCTIIVVSLALLFVFINIKRANKIYISSVWIFMTASVFVGALSYVWHLFNVPNAMYHRFINFYLFVILFIALQVLIHLEDIKLWHVVISGIIQIVFFAYTFFNLKVFEGYLTYIFTALLLVLYIVLLVFFCKKSIQYKNMLVVIVVFGFVELFASAYNAFTAYDSDTYAYELEVDDLIQKADVSLGERMTAAQVTPNIFCLSNKASGSGFVSAIDGATFELYDRLGMSCAGKVEYTIKGASPLLNLFFNLRYGVSDSIMEYSDAEMIEEGDNLNLYRMSRLAGLGYMVQNDVTEWDIHSSHCFAIQNEFLDLAVDGEPIFETVTPEIECGNIYGINPKRNKDEERDGSYVYDYETITGTITDAIQASFVVDEDMDLYLFEYSEWGDDIIVFVDGEQQYSNAIKHLQNTIHIGQVKKGQKIAIVLAPSRIEEKGVKKSVLLRFAAFNEEAYKNSYDKLSKNVYDISEMDSDYIKGSIQVEENGIMMTSISALRGFQVLVDGKETEYEVIGGAMIGVPLEEGEHVVEFLYNTPIPLYSKIVSVFGIVMFLSLCILDVVRKKKSGVESQEEVYEL